MKRKEEKRAYRTPSINKLGDMKRVTRGGTKNHSGSDSSNSCFISYNNSGTTPASSCP